MKKTKKLELRAETVRRLGDTQLTKIRGGIDSRRQSCAPYDCRNNTEYCGTFECFTTGPYQSEWGCQTSITEICQDQ